MPNFLKAEENKECKDVVDSMFHKWAKKEIYGEYDDNMNVKRLRASTFSKNEGGFVKFIRAREILYVRYKLGLNWEYMKYNMLEFNKRFDVEDGFKVSYRWIFNILNRSGIVGMNSHGEVGEKSDGEY